LVFSPLLTCGRGICFAYLVSLPHLRPHRGNIGMTAPGTKRTSRARLAMSVVGVKPEVAASPLTLLRHEALLAIVEFTELAS
jgi:hypothetical protein